MLAVYLGSMQTEIEAKFLDVNFESLKAKLTQLGGTCTHKNRLMRRSVFDTPTYSLEKENGWVRVRDEGDKITMTFKKLVDRSLHGTKEATVVVANFTDACTFLKSIGLNEYAYQETKRETWILNDCEIVFDEWPWIAPFIEIEAPSENTMKSVVQQLGLDWSKAMHGSVETVYMRDFDVTEYEVDHWQKITFIPVPEWLESKRKKQN